MVRSGPGTKQTRFAQITSRKIWTQRRQWQHPGNICSPIRSTEAPAKLKAESAARYNQYHFIMHPAEPTEMLPLAACTLYDRITPALDRD